MYKHLAKATILDKPGARRSVLGMLSGTPSAWDTPVAYALYGPGHYFTANPTVPWDHYRPVVYQTNPRIITIGRPNVWVPYVSLTKPFNIEDKPDPAVVEQLVGKYGARVEDFQNVTTNDSLYRQMSVWCNADLAKVNQDLQELGFDGIQYPGGRRVPSAEMYPAWVVFSARPSIIRPRPPTLAPSPPPR